MVLKVDDLNVKVPLHQAESLLSDEKFNRDFPLVIYISDYELDEFPSFTAIPLYKAYKCRGGHNFVVSIFYLVQ